LAAGEKSESYSVVVTAVIGNSLITVVKFFGWFISGSPSMMAEGIHSLADTGNQILLFIGLKRSEGGPSREFPWGRGNARYLWNLKSAVSVFFIGFGVTTYHGVHSLFHSNVNNDPKVIKMIIGILLFSLAVEGWVLFKAYITVKRQKGKMGWMEYVRKGDDPTSTAVLLEDGVAVLGVLLALNGVWLSQVLNTSLPDAITSIIIGISLGVLAIILGQANSRLLMGVAVEPELESSIKQFLEERPQIEKVEQLKTEIMAPGKVRLVVEVEFQGTEIIDREIIARDAEKIRGGQDDPANILVDTAERTVRNVGRAINTLESQIQQAFPQIAIIQVEVN
jgi:zinc transporter 9